MSDRSVKALREKRGRMVQEMRAIMDAASKEDRDMTADEDAKHREIFGAQEAVQRQIESAERTIEAERQMAAAAGAGAEAAREQATAAKPGERVKPWNTPEYRAGWENWLRTGAHGMSGDEVRNLQFTAPGTGENTRSPEQFVNQLIKKLDDMVVIRNLATHLQSDGSKTLGIPSLDADPADADWTTELLTGSLDATMAFGKRVMQPNALAKQLKVSKDLLRFSALPIEALVRERLAYKFAITLEKAYMTGSGVGQPLGLFIASANGIPTARDVATGNTATGVTFDGLIAAKYFVKAGYQATGQWLFHRDTVAMIAKLKDQENRYVWMPSVAGGAPDTILGRPVMQSEYVPNTVATGLYVGMFGDFSFYWIADSLEFLLERLNELYAATNQVGFIGRLFSDGAPVLGEAFARVKLG